jgi:hypothetical protein
MDTIENVVVEFQLDDNVVYVTRLDFINKSFKRETKYVFSYGTLSGTRKTSQSTYKSINGAMKKFNKAVDAIKNGTKIK